VITIADTRNFVLQDGDGNEHGVFYRETASTGCTKSSELR